MSIYDAVKQWALRSLPERWLLPLKKIHYGRVLDSGATDEPEFKVLAHLVRAGDVVMDLGANIGVYTRLLSDLVGARGTVYSLEPIPPTYEILRSVIQRYHLANVKPMAAAVSDHQYLAEMEVPRYPSGGKTSIGPLSLPRRKTQAVAGSPWAQPPWMRLAAVPCTLSSAMLKDTRRQ